VLRKLAKANCDLSAEHVYTHAEAFGLLEVSRALETPLCEAELEAAATLDPESGATPEFLERVVRRPGSWRRLRHYSARFSGPAVLHSASRVDRYWQMTWRDPVCPDLDCVHMDVRCEEGRGCEIYGEAPHYDKMVPLPFGEYIPLREYFPWLGDIIQGPGDFRAGTQALVFDGGIGRVAAPICYEGILSYVCDAFPDPDVLINVTNDAWFGTGAASALHGMLVTARATEMGLPVIRSTYSGISFVVEPHGDILYETGLFEEVSRPMDVRMAKVDTVFSAWGRWFSYLCIVGLLGGWILTASGRRSSSRAG